MIQSFTLLNIFKHKKIDLLNGTCHKMAQKRRCTQWKFQPKQHNSTRFWAWTSKLLAKDFCSNSSPYFPAKKKKKTLSCFSLLLLPNLLETPTRTSKVRFLFERPVFCASNFWEKNEPPAPLEQQKPGQTGCCWLVIVIAVFPWLFLFFSFASSGV